MISVPITDIEQATPEWLTETLGAKGYDVRVSSTYVEKFHRTNVSTVYHLLLNYTDTGEDAPHRLFLKIPDVNFIWAGREIQFYAELIPTMRERYGDVPFAVTCYDLAYDMKAKTSHLLMQNLSETHFVIGNGETPNREHYEQVIDGFALLHASWWEHPRLGNGLSERLTDGIIGGFIASAQHKFTACVDFIGERLSSEQHAVLTSVAVQWPERRRERVVSGQGITLIHRDPHTHNFLYPRRDGNVKIIDWDSWRVDTGTDDLAYMIVFHWEAKQRAALESDLLRRYYHRLIDLGVRNYSWDDCEYDYRASIIRCLFFLVNAWSATQWESGVWWSRIQKGIQAFQELECQKILD